MLNERQQIRHDLIISLIDKKGFKIDSNYAAYLIRYVDELFEYILNGEEEHEVYEKDLTDYGKKSCPEEPLKDEEVPPEPVEDAVEEKTNPWAPFENKEDCLAVLSIFYRVYKESVKYNDLMVGGYKEYNSNKIDISELINSFPNTEIRDSWAKIVKNNGCMSDIKPNHQPVYTSYGIYPFHRNTDEEILITDPLAKLYLSMYVPKEEVVESDTTAPESVEEPIIAETIDSGEIRGKSEESVIIDEYDLNIEKSELQNLQCYEVCYVGPYGKTCFETVPENHFPLEWAKIIRGLSSLNDIDFDHKVKIINNIIKQHQVDENENTFTEWLNDCIKAKEWLTLMIEPHNVEQLKLAKTAQNIVTPTDNIAT